MMENDASRYGNTPNPNRNTTTSLSANSNLHTDNDVTEPTMDQNDATDSINEQPQCQNIDECHSPGITPAPSSTTTPQQSAIMPSVEKRRRRLQQAAEEKRTTVNRHVGRLNERQWLENSTIVVMGAVLFLLLILQKDKIIHDIQRSRTRTRSQSNKRMIQIIIIMATHTIISPITYAKTIAYQLFHIFLRGITNPMGLPTDIWEFITFLCQDVRIAGGRMYTNLFGVRLSSKKKRIKEELLLPELENEETDPTLDNGDETILQQQQQQRQSRLKQELLTEKRIRYDIDDLPPAFLSNDKYPSGWLVYHPEYGVVVIEKLVELNRRLNDELKAC